MKNKVLIKLIVPELEVDFDVFIPVNELVWKVKKLLVKSVSDIMDIPLSLGDEYTLINKENCNVYKNNDIIINTDIRNGNELILISRK